MMPGLLSINPISSLSKNQVDLKLDATDIDGDKLSYTVKGGKYNF